MLVELHILQSFPPSNLNRDDVGSPKTATFGGAVRGRISSQCLKRSARLLLKEHGLSEAELGYRTKRVLERTVERLAGHGRDAEEAAGVVKTALGELGLGVDKDDTLTQYLLFLRKDAADQLAEVCHEHWDTLAAGDGKKKKGGRTSSVPGLTAILDTGRAVDIAMFGRMIADNAHFNVQAASQVAHALSTHAVVNDYDYYTAVDDLKPDDTRGADMIGTVEYNAACYYRYANLDLDQLAANLGGDAELARRAARAWLLAFVHAVPSGKQNSMAAHNPPSLVKVVVRRYGAWNLANAFARPVIASQGVIGKSVELLLSYYNDLALAYGEDDVALRRVLAVGAEAKVPDEVKVPSLTALVSDVDGVLA